MKIDTLGAMQKRMVATGGKPWSEELSKFSPVLHPDKGERREVTGERS